MRLHTFIILSIFSCVLGEDFYDILGIDRDADNKEIRRAFKKLALKLHPDKNKVSIISRLLCCVYTSMIILPYYNGSVFSDVLDILLTQRILFEFPGWRT